MFVDENKLFKFKKELFYIKINKLYPSKQYNKLLG